MKIVLDLVVAAYVGGYYAAQYDNADNVKIKDSSELFEDGLTWAEAIIKEEIIKGGDNGRE